MSDRRRAGWPRISVVTPSLNGGQYLEETILSVLDQSYPEVEYIVVDGGSHDATPEILDRHRDRIDRIIREPDEGQSDAIAKGFAVATGDVLAWLCADDLYLPDALAWVAEQFRRHPEADLVCGETNLDQGAGWEDWMALRYSNSRPTRAKLLACGQCVRQPGCFWTREAYERTGGMDRSLHYCMDYDLLLKLTRAGRARYVDHEIAWMRSHPASKSSTMSTTMDQERRRIVERELQEDPIPAWLLGLHGYLARLRFLRVNNRLPLAERIGGMLRTGLGFAFHLLRGDLGRRHRLEASSEPGSR